MTTQTDQSVPSWPHVSAVVRSDGTAEVTVNGTAHQVSALTIEDARIAVFELVRDQSAGPMGRPVRVHTREPSGQRHMIVHPDGEVHEAATGQTSELSILPDAADAANTADGVATTDAVDATRAVDAAEAFGLPKFPAEARAPRTAAAAPPTPSSDAWIPARPAPPAPPAAGPRPGPSPAQAAGTPTLGDLLASRPAPKPGPARRGWQGAVRRASGGWIKPDPGPAELAHREAIASVQRSLNGPKTIVVVNPKGGAHKTTASLLISATFGIHRGGYTLAWDNNETRGTLGWRAHPARHTNTAVDLLRDLDRFNDLGTARVGDLDNYVRTQGSARFDVLASDEDAAGAASIDAAAFQQLHTTLSRFYRVLVVDTGNNMRASNWQAAVAAADQLVIVSTVREDTAQSAAWLADGLRAVGSEEVVANAVTVLTSPSKSPDAILSERLRGHFSKVTRAVLDVPYDRALVDGGPINYDALSPASHEAWLRVSAAIAEGL